jgi:hypothetical protein
MLNMCFWKVDSMCFECVPQVLLAGDQTGETINENLIFFLFDGCRHGNESGLLQSFKKESDNKVMPKAKHQIFVMYDEASLAKRRGKIRGPNALDQVEYVHLVTASALKIDDVKRVHYSGTSFGNCIGPVTLPDQSDAWSVDVATKRKAYGTASRIDVGGKVPGFESVPTQDMPALEPGRDQAMCFHALPKELLEELTHCYGIEAWINCTGCEGNLEQVCIDKRLPMLSVVFTEAHKDLLFKRMVAQTFRNFQEESSDSFQPGLMAILGNKIKGKKRKSEEAAEKPGGKKAKGAGKPKKKAAKAKGADKPKPDNKKKGKMSALEKLKAMKAEMENEDDDEEEEEEDQSHDDMEDSGGE